VQGRKEGKEESNRIPNSPIYSILRKDSFRNWDEKRGGGEKEKEGAKKEQKFLFRKQEGRKKKEKKKRKREWVPHGHPFSFFPKGGSAECE